MADSPVIDVEPAGVQRMAPAMGLLPRVASSGIATGFAWGCIAGILFAAGAVYVIKKKL